MQSPANIKFANGSLVITGELNFFNIMHVWNESLPLLQQTSECCFDFSGVTACQSAALALLLEWIKYANKRKMKISFKGISEQLLSLANVAGIKEIVFPSP